MDRTCPNNKGETIAHLRTKLDIYQYLQKYNHQLRTLEIEKWICDRTLRSDVYIETDKNTIAIEVQMTPISVDNISERTEKYHRNGIYVLWVLPYEHRRFYDVKFDYHSKANGVVPFEEVYNEKVKLKEMEYFLLYGSFQQLTFWELEHKYSQSFLTISFDKHRGSEQTFWQDGEEQFHLGRISKTIKSVVMIEDNIEFSQFWPRTLSAYQPPFREYIIPNRKFMLPERKKGR